MIVTKKPLDIWQEWVPVSYNNDGISYISVDKEGTLIMICRAYHINDERIEIGDIWLRDDMRGKGIACMFMKNVISKIWREYKNSRYITLYVDKSNIKALKLYEKLKFKEYQRENNNIKMIRYKRSGIYTQN